MHGKSFWQVGASTEQNLTFKVNILKENYEILTNSIEQMIGDMELLPTDIIPLINKAWEHLFSEVECNKKCNTERG